MSNGNGTFIKAQITHKSIMQKRQDGKFDSTLIEACYTATNTYLKLLLEAHHLPASDSLLETVSFLKAYGVTLGSNALNYACTLQAMYGIHETDDASLIHSMVHAYISLRTLILEYLLDNFEPVWQGGSAHHGVTGVDIVAHEYSYTYMFELFYEI